MENNLVQFYDAAVPRYTSYPTAPHFSPEVDNDIYRNWLQELDPAKPLSLYLHVPYCRQMCWYCGCHTKITAQDNPVKFYANALRSEIRMLIKVLPTRFSVSHVHWGGGTPSILSSEDFISIMDLIDQNFDYTEDAERAIEIDPRTVDALKIEALAKGGVNRASLGIQDFNPVVQTAINRVQSFDVTKQAVENLRANGITHINFDLMYGLPLQTSDDVRRTVELSHSLQPDRIALFGYAHVPWMKSHMKMIQDGDLPETVARVEQAKSAAEELIRLGYQQIGLDHFALPDDNMSKALVGNNLNRNFQGYTTDQSETLIGIGASSIGSLPQGYAQNIVSIHEYERQILNNEFAISKGIMINTEDKIRREVIERLMCDLTVDLDDILTKFGKPKSFFSEEISRLQSLEKVGLLVLKDNRVTVEEDVRFLVRNVCAVFDTYLGTGAGRYSRAI